MICVYILRCADGTFYVGNMRRSVEERIGEHNSGVLKGYTSKRRPVELVYCEVTDSLIAACERERQLKGWSRAKKQALIDANWDALPALASRPRRR